MRVTNAHSRFRDQGTSVAWQRLIRDREAERLEGQPGIWDFADLSLKRAAVRPVTRAQSERVILQYEWLGTMAPTKWHFGIFFGDVLGGVTCVGSHIAMGGTPPHRQFGIDRATLRFLARGACAHWTPPGSASKLIAWTTRLMKQQKNGEVLLAYADPEAGEIGTVYQACGWYYIGRTAGSHGLVSKSGTRSHMKVLCNHAARNGLSIGEYEKRLCSRGWKPYEISRKYRYAYPLAEGVRATLERMSKPYPKREKRAATEETGSSDQEEQAGQNRPGRSNTNAEVTHGDEAQ